VCLDEMECTQHDQEYHVGDVVVLSCSVKYGGYVAPSLTWTDGYGNDTEAVIDKTSASVS